MEADRFPIEGVHGTGGDKSQLPVLPSPAWLPLVAVGGGAWAGGDTGPDSGTVTRPRHQARHGQDRADIWWLWAINPTGETFTVSNRQPSHVSWSQVGGWPLSGQLVRGS